MADTVRTRDQLTTVFVDNMSGAITAQDARDFIVSAFGYVGSGFPSVTNDRDDTAGVGAFFDAGSTWLDTANHQLWVCYDGTPGAAVWAIAGAPPAPVSYPITVDKGGTGLTSVPAGDLLAGDTGTSLQVVAAGGLGSVLTGNGAGNAPSFQPLPPFPSPVLVGNGGTGLTGVALWNFLLGSGGDPLNTLPPGPAGTFLQSQGASATPVWSNVVSQFLAYTPVNYTWTAGSQTLGDADVWLIINTAADVSIGGLGGTLTSGRGLIISNGNVVLTGPIITLNNEAGGATANQRIHTPDGRDCVLYPDETVFLWYDALVLHRWWVVAKIFDVIADRGVRTKSDGRDMSNTEIWLDILLTSVPAATSFTTTDRGTFFTYTGSADRTWNLPTPTATRSGLVPSGWTMNVYNQGPAILTLAPGGGGTINGLDQWKMPPYHGGRLSTDGTNWGLTDCTQGPVQLAGGGGGGAAPWSKWWAVYAYDTATTGFGVTPAQQNHSSYIQDVLGTWDRCATTALSAQVGWTANRKAEPGHGMVFKASWQWESNLGRNLDAHIATFVEYTTALPSLVTTDTIPNGYGVGCCRRRTDANVQFLVFDTALGAGGGSDIHDSGIAAAEGVSYELTADFVTVDASHPILTLRDSNGNIAVYKPTAHVPPTNTLFTVFGVVSNIDGTAAAVSHQISPGLVDVWLKD